jgi:hypothetical protein
VAATVLKHCSDIVFLFVGEGQHRRWIEEQVQHQQLTNVVLKPFQPKAHLAESLSVPEVHLISLRPELEGFVVPSKFYGAPAAGRGVLFIGDPAGETGQLVNAGYCCATIPEGDQKALCDWILRLRRSPEICAAWGRNARAFFEVRFDQRAAFAGWPDLLTVTAKRPLPVRGAFGQRGSRLGPDQIRAHRYQSPPSTVWL